MTSKSSHRHESAHPEPEGPISGHDPLGPVVRQYRIDDVSIGQLLDLEPHGTDTFLGIAPEYPMPRLFGGQVVAQALRAAQLTVEPEFPVHSLHAYFIRAGTSTEPVRFEVERIRNGRSFRTRRVVARQSGGAILNLSASFQRNEESVDVQPSVPPPDVGHPDGGERTGWGSGLIDRRVMINETARFVSWLRLGRHDLDRSEPGGPDLRRHGLNGPNLMACGLAFLSDSMPTGAVRATHPKNLTLAEARKEFSNASLDHVVYFHRPADPHRWLLSDARCHSLVGGRGLVVVNVFTETRSHVLTVVQEVLMRERAAKPV